MIVGVYLHYVLCYVYIGRVAFQYSGRVVLPYGMVCTQVVITVYNQFGFSAVCDLKGVKVEDILRGDGRCLKLCKVIFLCDLFYFNSKCLDKLKKKIRKFEEQCWIWINGARFLFCALNLQYLIKIQNSQDYELACLFCYFYIVTNLLNMFDITKYFMIIVIGLVFIACLSIWNFFTFILKKCKKNHHLQARAEEQQNIENGDVVRENRNDFDHPQVNLRNQLEDNSNNAEIEREEEQKIPNNYINNVQNNEGFQVNMRNLAFAFMDAANHQKKFLRLDSTLSVEMMMKNWSRKFTEEDTNACPSCCVCLEDFEVGENIMELHCNPKSHGHMFHLECIDSWSKKEKTCPLCRKNFIDIVRDEYSRGVLIKKKNEEFKAPGKLEEASNISEERKEVDRTVQSRRDLSENYEPSPNIYESQNLSLHRIEANEPYDPISSDNNKVVNQPDSPVINDIQLDSLQAQYDPSAPALEPNRSPRIHYLHNLSIHRHREREPSNQGFNFYPQSSFSESMSSEMDADSA
ncbi:unnamed protein product [Moneuplotes crassus]|uniref:RING-type E3 ubiquitin transferase n=1 Tax=Euplotes crassus TaxID=5936 RepID=A0AAD1U7J4_EUPCR|nr:unnamed protein product [Moneuplotes crassus]